MKAAMKRTHSPHESKLLIISKEDGRIEHTHFSDLPRLLHSGDLLVVNDAATLPASFSGHLQKNRQPIEMRLASALSEIDHPSRWLAIFFGEGDWHIDTEKRLPPPKLLANEIIEFETGLLAKIKHVLSPRLAEIEFLGDDLWKSLYTAGKPIQYSHLSSALQLWDVQTILAGPPVAIESPSASFPFNWELVLTLKQKGVEFTHLTHAAGISSTGDAEIDRMLPMPERFWISNEAARKINEARKNRKRIIAIGTSVTRALESAAENQEIQAGSGVATLLITPKYRHKIVNGVMSGFHEQGASHLKLLGSFISPSQLEAAYQEAERHHYLGHEYGDSCLIV